MKILPGTKQYPQYNSQSLETMQNSIARRALSKVLQAPTMLTRHAIVAALALSLAAGALAKPTCSSPALVCPRARCQVAALPADMRITQLGASL